MRIYFKVIVLLFCIVLNVADAHAQQAAKVINKFRVVDAKTNAVIPGAVVNIHRAGLMIATEDDGVLHIPGNIAAMRDTIVFYAQNYAPLKLPLSKLANMQMIPLSRLPAISKNVPAKFTGAAILNDHVADDIAHYAGVASEDAPFNYLQIAQQFGINSPGNRLSSVTIHKTVDWISTKFRVRIYDVDPITGGPGADLCDQVIDIDNQKDVENWLGGATDWEYYIKSRRVELDLKKYNVIIPGKTFYVAVEWLRNFLNAVRAPVFNAKTNKTDSVIVYRPYIGLSPAKGTKLNIWVMGPDRRWKTYDHFMPFGTDLAIKAVVETQ